MRGKIAREIRKELNYHPRKKIFKATDELPRRKVKAKRPYKTFAMCVKIKKIYQIDEEGGVNLVDREVPRYLTECVSGDRKVYQAMKRHYTSCSQEELKLDMHEMPSEQDLKKLTEEISEMYTNEKGSQDSATKENEDE